MGTYTINKNLYMPTVGEQGWGTLVNGNFETIDNFLKPISLSGSTYTFTGNHVGNQSGGSITATSISNSGNMTNTGTLTCTGKIYANGGIDLPSLSTGAIAASGLITANGGIKGNITGNITGNTTGFLFVKGTVGTSGDVNYATCPAISHDLYQCKNSSRSNPTSILTFTVNNYSISFGNPVKHGWGVYTRRSDLSGTTSPSVSTRTFTITINVDDIGLEVYYKLSSDSSYTKISVDSLSSSAPVSTTLTLNTGSTYNFYCYQATGIGYFNGEGDVVLTSPALTTYKVKYATP